MTSSSGRSPDITDWAAGQRGGDRQANSTLWQIATTRMFCDPQTRAHVTRRTTEGLSKKEIMRCPNAGSPTSLATR